METIEKIEADRIKIEKIKAERIKIENGRLIGLGINGADSISLNALNELMDATSPIELSEVLSNTVQRIGSLGLYLYKAGDSVPDPQGAIISSIPDENELYIIHLVSKLFRA